MKTQTFNPTLPILALLVLACAQPSSGAAVGEPAPGFTLTATDGTEHALEDYRGRTVVLEWINPNCPFSRRAADERLVTSLTEQHADVVFLGINSTAESHRDFLTPADHSEYNRTVGIDFPVLYDAAGDVGHAYGAQTTPHMMVIDDSGILAYNGALDDDPSGRTPLPERTNYVDGALTAMAAGQSVDPAVTKPYGCSVKYGS